MLIKEKWRKLTLFWKIYLIAVLLIAVVVTLVEGLAEFVVEPWLFDATGIHAGWQEFVYWIIGVIVPTIVVAQLLTGYLSRKFTSIALAAQKIARGDLDTRLEVENENDALGKMSTSFNQMAEDLQRLVSNERRLLADISHELRSPLARMSLSLELVNRHSRPEIAPYLDRMENEINRMNEMVGLLLEHGRKSLGYEAMERLDISELINESCGDFRFQAEQEGKRLNCKIEPGLAAWGNAFQLQLMFGNILSNALRYTASNDGQVDLHARREGANLKISIRDYGPGVPVESLENIFRAFYRTDDSRNRDSGGVGLGLAIAKQAVLSCGGTIRAFNCSPGLQIDVMLPSE